MTRGTQARATPACAARNTRKASLKREYGTDDDDPPIAAPQPGQRFARDRIHGPGRHVARRFPYAEGKQRDGEQAGDDRHPEDGPEVIDPGQHQPGGEQGADESAHRVERLSKAERRSADGGRRDVGDQGIARRAADALADTVDEPGGNDGANALGEREHRLGEGAHGVAEHGQPLAPAQVVAQCPREHLRDQRGGLGNALDDADGQHADAKRPDEKQRQQAVDHLGGDVHQHAHEAENPDARRDAMAARDRLCLHGPL